MKAGLGFSVRNAPAEGPRFWMLGDPTMAGVIEFRLREVSWVWSAARPKEAFNGDGFTGLNAGEPRFVGRVSMFKPGILRMLFGFSTSVIGESVLFSGFGRFGGSRESFGDDRIPSERSGHDVDFGTR